MIKPLGDRVVLKINEIEEKAIGGIFLPTNTTEKSTQGTVVAVSVQSVGELSAPMQVKKGDEVLFDKFSGTEIKIDNNDYLVIHEKDIIGIL